MRLYKEIKISLTGLKPVKNGYFAYTEFEDEVEKLLTDKAKTTLNNIGLDATLPPKVRAQRSIICRQLDVSVGENSAEDLKLDIDRRNPLLQVQEIVKLKNYTHVFKIEFKTTKMADIASQNGLLCYNL